MSFPRSYYTNQSRHAYFCSCGKVVHGNGGRAGHAYMHEQRKDGHHEVSRSAAMAQRPLHNADSDA